MLTTIVTLTNGALVIRRAEDFTLTYQRESTSGRRRVYGGEARILKSGKLGAIKGASDSGYSLLRRAYVVWVDAGRPAVFEYDEDGGRTVAA